VTNVHLGTKMNRLEFEIKISKVVVTTRPNMVKNHLFRCTGRRFSIENHLVATVVSAVVSKDAVERCCQVSVIKRSLSSYCLTSGHT